MRDPHVVTLQYRVVTDPLFEFKDPPPIEHEEAAFRLRLEDGTLRVEMKDHYATEAEARDVVDPFLDAWEIDAALKGRRRDLRFQFERVRVEDREPDGNGRMAETCEVGYRVDVAVKAEAHEYPSPPARFVASPDVRALMYRYERYAMGRETLLSMANWCLTLVEQRGMAAAHAQGQAELTKRQSAARLYAISDDVLGLLGRLCATRGDAVTARKFDPQGSALTPEETAWIEAAVRSLIRRVGEHDFDPAGVLARITMANLPTVLPR